MGLADRSTQLAATAARLRLDAAAADLFAAFDRAGVNALLLKGRSIAQWLYADSEPRPYMDCDFLIAPGNLSTAEAVMESAGYRRALDDRSMPSWWREHATAWLRESDDVTVDLHRTLVGVAADAQKAWRVLSEDPLPVVAHGREVPALSLAGRALQVVLHAAQHGVGWAAPLEELRRALEHADDGVWSAAAALATELQAMDAFVTGLQLTPEGAQLAARLGLPRARSTDAMLRAAAPPPLALGFEQLARAPTWRARAAMLCRKALPPGDFVRHWDPRAGDSRTALARAYLRRPLWLVRHAPAGFQAWRRARLLSRGSLPRNKSSGGR